MTTLSSSSKVVLPSSSVQFAKTCSATKLVQPTTSLLVPGQRLLSLRLRSTAKPMRSQITKHQSTPILPLPPNGTSNKMPNSSTTATTRQSKDLNSIPSPTKLNLPVNSWFPICPAISALRILSGKNTMLFTLVPRRT